MTTTHRDPTVPARVLYTIVCAAPPALHVQALVSQARQGGWDTCLILTPTAARWLGLTVR